VSTVYCGLFTATPCMPTRYSPESCTKDAWSGTAMSCALDCARRSGRCVVGLASQSVTLRLNCSPPELFEMSST